MSDLLKYLTTSSVLGKLSPDDLGLLSRTATCRTYQRGEFICRQDELWPKAIYILEGKIEWSIISPEGKRQVVFNLGEREVVWAHSLFDGLPMPASLEVMSKSTVYLWEREVIVPILSRNPEAMWEVMRVLVTAMRRVRDVVYGFAFHPVSGRLARFLIARYQPVGGQTIPRDLTLDELAAVVGTTRELICKVLYHFAEEEIVTLTRNEILFLDTEKLASIARDGKG